MSLLAASPSPLGRAVLELLAAEGQPVSRSDIKRQLGLAESHLSHLLRDLETEGLIVRRRAGTGREVFVELGPEGRRVAESALLPRWVEHLAGLIAGTKAGAGRDRTTVAGELVAAGAPSRAAADRLAQALAERGVRHTAQRERSPGEIREPSPLGTTATGRMDIAGPALQPWIEAAATARGQGVHDYVVEALRERLAADGFLPGARPTTPGEAARLLDGLRRQVGPVGVPARELVLEGRRR